MKQKGSIITVLILQIVVYVIVHEVGVRLVSVLFDKTGSGLNWGITVKYSLLVFSLIAIGLAVVQSIIVSSKKELLLLSISCLVFCAYYFTDLGTTPYRTVLLMISGVLGLSIPILIKRKYITKTV